MKRVDVFAAHICLLCCRYFHYACCLRCCCRHFDTRKRYFDARFRYAAIGLRFMIRYAFRPPCLRRYAAAMMPLILLLPYTLRAVFATPLRLLQRYTGTVYHAAYADTIADATPFIRHTRAIDIAAIFS